MEFAFKTEGFKPLENRKYQTMEDISSLLFQLSLLRNLTVMELLFRSAYI